MLLVSAPERDEIYLADDQLRSPEAVLETVIRYQVQAQRAEILGLRGGDDERPPPEFWVQMRLEAFERRLRSRARVVEAYRLHVPYWHITGWIVQAILGRRADGPKLMRVRAFALEHSVPAYDPQQANLRDRGLRLSRSRVRPLTVREVRERGAFLAWAPVPERSYREIDRWRGQDLDPGTQPVARHAAFLDRGRVLVYRPYWLARVAIDEEQWVLADGGFGTIAGHPDAAEARTLLGVARADPLHSGEPSFRRVHVVASRCPECGFEKALAAGYHVHVCPNCHRGLGPAPDGLRLVPYGHCVRGEERLDGDYLPFWRYRFRIEMADAPAIERLEDYGRALFPQGAPPGFRPSGEHLWVPAFRLLGTEAGDETFKDLAEWVHAAGLEARDEKIPVGGRPVTWGASLSEAEARELLPFVIAALHGKTSAARLNTLLLQRALTNARLTPSAPELVMVPFDPAGEALCIAGTALRVPKLLLTGGPQLDAQRASVHQKVAGVQG
ncbi:MAG: hypothetical protein DMF50_10300 [Acidobacteria bacterium]|nr:MAG: hypothetical protein DMF50_10300 [Acidobacteriota bacterium]